MKREFYSSSIAEFGTAAPGQILAELVTNNPFTLEQAQRDAWLEEIDILQRTITRRKGVIYFEYAVPRMGKRIDARKTPLHPERYYPHARIRVFHHSGPEIPGSAREGNPRSFFLCFRRPAVSQSPRHRPAIVPRGSKVLGNVMESKQAGRLVGRAQTQIVLTSIFTADSCEYPIDAKILEAGRYTANREGVIVGRGHARRDLFELLFPPTTIYQLIRIPSRGPSLVIDSETPITIKLMEPLTAQSAGSQGEVSPSLSAPRAPGPARV